MACSPNKMPQFYWIFVSLILFVNACHGFYFPEEMYTKRNTFSVGDEIYAKVNSLTSTTTELPLSYYSLPYCEPQGGVKKSAMNIGQLLMGDEIKNSPYRFQMNVNETVFLCVKGPFTAREIELLKQRIRDQYRVNLILDYLPVISYPMYAPSVGISLGYMPSHSFGPDYCIINHLYFRVSIHEHRSGFEIVGFEAVPNTVNQELNDMSKLDMHQPIEDRLVQGQMQPVRVNDTVAFTYSVEFVKSDMKWSSRWDIYMEIEGAEVGRQSILFSVLVFFISQVVMNVRLRTIRRDMNRYKEVDNEALMNHEAVSGWRLVAGDVFREPGCAKLLCVMVGDGVQITATTLVTIAFSALGFVSPPASRGMLLTTWITLYLLFSIVSGYAAARLWRTVKGASEGWKSVSLYTTFFFPGIVFAVYSTRAIPISLFFSLLCIWFGISVPLTLIGGFIATKLSNPVPQTQRTSHIPRQVPVRDLPGLLPFKSPSWVHVFVVGFALRNLVETVSSRVVWRVLGIWFDPASGDLLVLLLMFVVYCAESSVVFTYARLSVEDWRWWWKAFFTCGSVGVYMLVDSVNDVVFELIGPVSVAVYVGYSLVTAVAVMLATGTFGFLVSFCFVRYLYSSAKISC